MQPTRTAQILVVDDEPGIRELLTDALSDTDVEVRTAATGKEAIDIARAARPDVLVTDLHLGDCNGLEVIDSLRDLMGDVPTVVITGHADAGTLTEASRSRPIELMTKPLNIERLRHAVRRGIAQSDEIQRLRGRVRKLRDVAHNLKRDRTDLTRRLDTTCAGLSAAYRELNGQLGMQKALLDFQGELIRCKSDDDVFRILFRLFVRRSGPVHGVAMVCDANAQLRTVGRFGVPKPDSLRFCEALCDPMVDAVLAQPHCMLIDAGDEADLFDESIRRYLPGLSVLVIPLIPAPGEMIGLVVLYRKGEQPFTDGDVAIAEIVGTPAAAAVQRND